MAWNPEQYNEFTHVRYLPFYDIIAHISDKPGMNVLDLGCGTGALTKMLADKLSYPDVLGVDSSAEMLQEAHSYTNTEDKLAFKNQTIEATLDEGGQWDLIFSNAALQWVGNHALLFPKIISLLHPEGQLAIQMPVQNDNVLNQVLAALAEESPFKEALKGWRSRSPVLPMDDYAQLLFDHGAAKMTIYQKIYPLIADSHLKLYDFISGTALIPYLERLDDVIKEAFIAAFKNRIAERFTTVPALYAFKRMIIYAQF